MKYLIGIDIGTGSTKAVALNLSYEAIATSQAFYTTAVTQPGYSEQNPDSIVEAFLNCIRELVIKLKSNPIAIGLSSAMHSLIMVDENGNALAPMMTWADNRSAEEAQYLKNSQDGTSIYKATGTPIHAMSPLCKIIWLRKNNPDLFSKTKKFISIKEYIWFKLFGVYQIDYSIASSTGLFDIHKLKWNKKALTLAGILPENLSEPVQTNYSLKASSFLERALLKGLDTTFVIGASDGCMANLGSEAIADGVAAITIGTSGALRLAHSKPIFNSAAMTFSYILDDKTYICGGPINNGGSAVQWLLKNIFGKSNLQTQDYTDLFEQINSTSTGDNPLFFLPYLSGERAPLWDSEACGTFFGLNLRHEQKHLARAVIEGICYSLNDVLKAVENNNTEISQINVSGGFVHSKIWMQILADITGKKLVLVSEEDASAVGAAYLAAKATGLSENYPLSKKTKSEIILPNQENYMRYQKTFLIFKTLYANLNSTMHQLHHLNS